MANFFSKLFAGTPAKVENKSTLRPEQEALYQQLVNAGKGQGAGGAFGGAADYYRNLLSDDSADYNAFAAPAMRQFQQDIIPEISEQFAGMGAGGLSSSGFRNAGIQAGTDLAERLGAIRANLRQAGAQGLQNIGQQGLNNFSQSVVTDQGSPGLLGMLSPAIGSGIASAVGGPIGDAISNSSSNWFQGKGNRVGSGTSGYQSLGTGIKASPSIGGGFQLPNFLQGGGRGY